jgi:hypothetical protein
MVTTRFVQPTLEQLQAYAVEIGYTTFDAQDFLDHYEMVGWVVGKARTPMKSWRPAVRVWQRRQAAWAGAAAAPVERDPVILQYAAQGKRIIAGGGFEIGRFWSKVRDAIGPDGLARVKALARGQTGA